MRKSGESADSIERFIENVQGRIVALGRAHDHSMRSAGDVVDLRELAADVLSPWTSGDGAAVSFDGRTVGIEPGATQTLSLVLYELATNAAKYGALSSPDGVVKLEWSEGKRGDLKMTWIESGGPRVDMPSRKGFGSMVIDKMISLDLNGEVVADFRASGLEVAITVPSASVKWNTAD